jgi:hypothetical protein
MCEIKDSLFGQISLPAVHTLLIFGDEENLPYIVLKNKTLV